MGWNSWNSYGCSVSSEKIKKTVKNLKDGGYDKLGYKYIIIDDCWQDN